MPVRWAVLGAGRVADTWTCPAIKCVEGSVLSAVVVRGGDQAFAERHGIGIVANSLDDLLENEDLDAVYIGTPNALHADQVVACAEHGKAVLCEKPLALTSDEARRAVTAAENAGIVLGVNFQYRYHPALLAARELIARGDLGEPILVQAEIGGSYALRTWRRDRALAGFGAIVNMGVHVYDAVEFVLGGLISTVSAVTNESNADPETIALAIFELDTGVPAYVNANQAVPESIPYLTVDGTEGRIHVANCFRLGAQCELQLIRGSERQIWQLSSEAMFESSIAEFAEAVRERHEAPIPGSVGVHSAAVVAAVARAASTGARVSLEAEVAA